MIPLSGTGNQANTSIGFTVPLKGNYIVGVWFKATSPIPPGEHLSLTPHIPGTNTKALTAGTVEVSDPFLATLDTPDDITYSVAASAGATGVTWQAEVRISQGNDIA